MEFHFFTVPVLNPDPAQDDLNRLCASRRVVGIERQFVAAGQASFWAVCVTVTAGAGPLPEALKTPDRKFAARGSVGAIFRIDYKQALRRPPPITES